MQMIGEIGDAGFTLDELKKAKKWFKSKDSEVHIYELCGGLDDDVEHDPAYILIAKKGADAILKEISNTSDNFFDEQKKLPMDKKALMYGRVVNKHARWNLCFGPEAQDPDIESGKGTIVPFEDVPCLEHIRISLPKILGKSAENLVVEGNYYYDSEKCGIGYHGDTERTKVVAVRLGKTMPICYQWYHNSEPVGENMSFDIEHGDLYVMSDKAVGRDWKKKSIYTLRHAAGCAKFTSI
jgi:alkylated DNA repair dioxygenase AlkB